MLSTSAKVALIAVLELSSHFTSASAQSATATAMDAMSSEGCYASSGDLVDQGSYTWQTSGYCQKICIKLGKPVLGLSKGGNCWCGDLLPAADTKVSSTECDTPCDGYDQEDCGGSDAWTIWLTGTSSNVGSVGGSSNSVSSSSSSSSSTSIIASSLLISSTAASSTPSSTLDATSVAATTAIVSSSSTTNAAVYTTATTAPTVVSTVTVGGSVRTIVASTSAAATDSSSSENNNAVHSSGPNKAGIAAGVVVGILAIVALVVGVVLFLKRRSRKANESTHRRQSSLHAWAGGAGRGAGIAAGVRGSTMNDSRLDPRIMVERRQSDGSVFADNEDYSRRILKVTNPDGA